MITSSRMVDFGAAGVVNVRPTRRGRFRDAAGAGAPQRGCRRAWEPRARRVMQCDTRRRVHCRQRGRSFRSRAARIRRSGGVWTRCRSHRRQRATVRCAPMGPRLPFGDSGRVGREPRRSQGSRLRGRHGIGGDGGMPCGAASPRESSPRRAIAYVPITLPSSRVVRSSCPISFDRHRRPRLASRVRRRLSFGGDRPACVTTDGHRPHCGIALELRGSDRELTCLA